MAAEKTVICYGDSNTYGFDPRMGCPERLPRRVRWTGRLDALPGLRIINEGMNGREIPHTAAAFSYLDRILERNAGADILFIMLGTNDLFGFANVTAGKIALRLQTMIDSVPLLGTYTGQGRRLIIAAPPLIDAMADDPFFGYQSEQILTASAGLAAAYRPVAEKAGAEFVDTAGWRIPMTFDGVHFSEEGHRIFAGHMAALLEK